MPESQPITLRTCRSCLREQPIENFPLTRGKRFYRCARCVNAQSLKWQAENREKSNQIKRDYEARNPDFVREVKTRYAKQEHVKERSRKRKSERQPMINAQCREQYAADATSFKIRNARRESRERQADGVFTKLDRSALLLKQSGRCANPQCRADLSFVKSVADHIVALVYGGSHWPHNRQLLCMRLQIWGPEE